MKFSSDKKSALFIYTNENLKSSDDKMESVLKKELEATKSALKLQTIRCRQLVAAFTRKLHEKEIELRASKDLRDQQLSRLLRALLILESRLKKEQKLIRKQLEEKDLIIEKQEKEILIYKLSETNKKWPKLETSDTKKETNEEKWESRYPKTTGEERLDNLCKGLINNQFYEKKNENELDKNKDSKYVKKEENTFKDNPVLESVNQILLRDEEELLKEAQQVDITLNEKVMFDGAGDSNEWYEINSNTPNEHPTSEAWCIKMEEGEEIKPKKEIWLTGKTSPIKSQHQEEKACLEMSKKNLTIVNLEEIDSNNEKMDRPCSPAKSAASYEEILTVPKSPNSKCLRTTQKPPALPPKPARLLKPHQILQQKNKELCKLPNNGESLGGKIQIQTAPSTIGFAQIVNKNPRDNNNLTQLKISTNHRHVDNNRPRPKPPDPSLKLKINQVNSFTNFPLDGKDASSQLGNQKKNDEHNSNCGAIKIGSSVSSLITGLSKDTIVTELIQEPLLPSDDSRVSQMVRQFEVLGKFNVTDNARTEDEINDMRKNFEEFKLEESYVEAEESGRHDGDGAETRNMVNYYAALTIVPPPPPPPPKEPPPGSGIEYKMYETFLENTGLSQKSILTPSRMLSNHRSCLKPKDVKHRSRVKAAAAIEKCHLNPTNPESTVKYWTEPFL